MSGLSIEIPLFVEKVPHMDHPLVVFDVQEHYVRDQGRVSRINILNADGEIKVPIVSTVRTRLGKALQLSDALIQISQLNPDDDNWIELQEIVPWSRNRRWTRDERDSLVYSLKKTSVAFGGLLEFQNAHKITEVKPSQPFGVAFTVTSRKVLDRLGH